MLKELQLLGLGKNDALVYEALVKHGPCRAGLIINRLDIHRNLVYQSLERLVLKGYATKVIVKGVWTFQITDPHSLLSSFRIQEKVLSSIVEQINTTRDKSRQQIVVYEGLESYRSYWLSSLERIPVGITNHVLGGMIDTSKWKEIMGYMYNDFNKLRRKKKLKWKIIIFKLTKGDYDELGENPGLTEFRLLHQNTENVGNINVFHDTIILHTWGEPYRVIEIRDRLLVQMFQNYFDIIWNISKPVKLEKK